MVRIKRRNGQVYKISSEATELFVCVRKLQGCFDYCSTALALLSEPSPLPLQCYLPENMKAWPFAPCRLSRVLALTTVASFFSKPHLLSLLSAWLPLRMDLWRRSVPEEESNNKRTMLHRQYMQMNNVSALC